MQIAIYGKAGCKKCLAAKNKLEIMGLPFSSYDLFDYPPDWRDKGLSMAMAEYQLTDTLPVIRIDDQYMGYPPAMKILKKSKPRKDQKCL